MLLLGRICRLGRIDLGPEYAGDPRAQGLAIREHNLQDTANGRAILDWLQSNGNVIAGLEDLLAPPKIGHVRRITRFGNPMDDVSFFIRYIEFQETMRIGPEPFCDRRLHGELLIDVEAGVAMMRKKRGHADEKSQP